MSASSAATTVRAARGRRFRGPEHPPSPVIAFFGLFGVGNFGNEASLRAAHESIRQLAPEAHFVCIAESPARVAEEHGLPACSNKMAGVFDRLQSKGRWARLLLRPIVEPARWISAIRFLRKVDVVIVPGTGILDDFGVRPWQMPYDLFRWSLACRLTRTKLSYLSIGAGPIHHRLSRWLMKRAVGFADYCSYRDQGSRDYMSSIGRVVDEDPVFPDLAFSLARPPEAVRKPGAGPVTIGVGVMSYFGWTGRGPEATAIHAAYVERLELLCTLMVESGCRIRILTGQDSDAATVLQLQEQLSRRHPGMPPLDTHAMSSMADVLRTVAESDLVVATRFHNVVGALMMHRPVISLGYAEKNRGLLEATGLSAFAHRVENFDPGEVAAQIGELIARAPQAEVQIASTDADYREALALQYRRVIADLTGAVSGPAEPEREHDEPVPNPGPPEMVN
jgi:polysaccharide pyruvyl transferase WcaK-like protein